MCVYLCVNVRVCVCNCNTEDAKFNTEDTQLELDLLSEDKNFGNCGHIHSRTHSPNVDVLYTVRIKIKVIHIQRPIVLKSNDLKICMWHIGEEQLILFLLVPFLHQVCHAWPSTLPLKMTMSWPTFCKFWQLDKSPIDKQCNGVAAEIVSSHAR